MSNLPINRVAGFGGKLGETLADFNGHKVIHFCDLVQISRAELITQFGDESASWMLNAAVGID